MSEFGMTEEMKMRVINAAGMRMLGIIADDSKVAELAREFPDEVTRIFMAGCQAGAESYYIVIKDALT